MPSQLAWCMRRFSSLLTLAFALSWCIGILASACIAFGQDSPPGVPRFRLIGYLPNYRLAKYDWNHSTHLTDLILFSADAQQNGTVELGRLSQVDWDQLQRLKATHGLRLHLCIGGWGRSQAFASIAADAKLRSVFAHELRLLCERHHLDGVDIDWEHPSSPREVANYGQLLATIKEVLAPSHRELSVTMAGWQDLTPEGFQAVDRVQVMAYDRPGRHSTFDDAVAEVEQVIQKGADRSKVILGIPFYGRHVEHWESVKTFAQLADHPDYQPSTDELDGYYFNGPDTATQKTRWARDYGLQGVMVWELGQDTTDDRSLLRAIRNFER